MNSLILNIIKYQDDIIEAISEVYGLQYKEIIKERFNQIKFNFYTDKEGINSYYYFLIDCKVKELCLEFLSNIGIDLTKYNIKNYINELPQELSELCLKYLGNYEGIRMIYYESPIGFKSILEKYNHNETTQTIQNNQINFINFIRNNNQINNYNLEEFKKTKEYKKIYKLATKLDKIYEQIINKMKEYIQLIKIYKDYFEKEEERFEEIYQKYLKYFYLFLEDKIDINIQEKLDKEKTITDKIIKLLSPGLEFTYIEYFSEYYEEKLNDPKIDITIKNNIYYNRLFYFISMGIDINISSLDLINIKEEYDKIIKKEEIKSIIPSKTLVAKIYELRKYLLDKLKEEFIQESEEYKDLIKEISTDETDKKIILEIMKKKEICTILGNTKDNLLKTYIFLTIRKKHHSIFDYIIIHEIIHAIESSITPEKNYRSGFEFIEKSIQFSPYQHKGNNKIVRKYEKLNEIITDILAMEVRNNLLNKGIYIIEPKERTEKNNIHYNTSKLEKKLLKPFFDKYRDIIIKTRIYGNIEEFKEYIGTNNYEELNDTIDYINYLIEQGLEQKLENNLKDDEIVIEYNIQLERLNLIYEDIDKYTNINQQQTHNSTNNKSKKKKLKNNKKGKKHVYIRIQ